VSVQPAVPSLTASLRIVRRIAAMTFAAGLVLAVPAVASADPGDVGFQGPAGAGGAPSGSKPESKLWFNDGSWWGSLWDTTTNDFYIWKLNQATETWSRTNTRLDDRSSTRADVLWDGTKLYVASHNFSENDGPGTARLYRLSYDTSTDTYSVDAGFPKTINSVKTETLVIAKDSTGLLWATWEAGGHIWINHTVGGDTNWNATPIQLPGAAAVNTDDISSIIAFGGNKVGVFWSNQNASPDADYFAIHQDGAADTDWTIETAYTGTNLADDHVNLKTDSGGKVYAVVKTSLDNAGSSPLIVLLDRATNGTWSSHTVSVSSLDQTRPILEIDETNQLLRVFVTSGGSGGTINQHTSPIGSISFPGGTGTIVMKDASAMKINNASSTKQNVTAATGLIVLAFNDTTKRYWHADILGGGGPPPNTPPTANATSATTPAGQAVSVPLSGSDPETCDLSFSIVTQPSHGTLGSINNASCVAGSPNTDTASVAYTPAGGYQGPDSFTYKVNDGTDDSAAATASLTVTATGGGGGTFTFTATEDAQVKSTSPTTNFGTLSTLQLREEAAPGVTYRDYLKFNVNGMSGTVSSVKLRLFITDVSPDSGTVFGMDTNWSENSIVWNDNPSHPLGSAFGSAGATSTVNTWVEIPLIGSNVTGNVGNVAFLLKTTSTNSSIFNSSEGANPPELVVTTTSAGDTTKPVFQSGTINGSALTLTYNEALDPASTPSTTDLTISGRTLSNISVSGTNVTATVAPAAVSTDTIAVNYTPGTNPIQDLAGNDADPLTNQAVTNNTPPADITPPAKTGQTVNGASLVIGYNEALDTGSVPAASAFDVQVGGSARNVSNVGVSGQNVTLTLATQVISTDSVTVAYTAPATNPVQDVAGNDAASFSSVAVTNNTPPPNTPPSANATSATTPAGQAVSVGLSGSDPETCQLTFSIVTQPSHGTLGSISNASCVAGSPNTDSASVTYTPSGGYSGPDSFTYKVNDGAADSSAATASITVLPPSGGGTFTFVATEDAQVKSTSPTTNYGSLTTMQLREEPAGGTLPTYRDYLKFRLNGISGTVTSVKLRLYITDSGTVYGTSTGWSEATIMWGGANPAPALGTAYGSAGATTTANTYIEITLDPAAVGSPDGNGDVAFGIKTTSTNSSIFESSEGAHAPELVVTTS
jgi:uncharacterized repeat protein (TIGR02059 family)